jgi:hypothetical protein
MPRTRRTAASRGKRSTRKRRPSVHSSEFSSADYDSGNGMMTTIWGPPLWHVLHTMSFNYPVRPTAADKKRYADFVRSLAFTLPCGKCRQNLTRNLRSVPLTGSSLASRAAFSRWMYRFHEHVNRGLGKKSGLSYEQVRDRYEHFRARCVAPTPRVESGCTGELGGRKKSKCVLKIVPHDDACKSLVIDQRCKR